MISTLFSWADPLIVNILYFSKFVIEWNLFVTDRYTVYPHLQLDIEIPKKGNVQILALVMSSFQLTYTFLLLSSLRQIFETKQQTFFIRTAKTDQIELMHSRAAMFTHVNGTVSCFCNKHLQN